MELVSVIIPTYNRAHLVSDAISSVLKQTYKNYEILVIDDGSTDETEHVIKHFNDKIRYIYQENKGAGAARNRGLKEAKGSYIAFLDSDDLWLDFKLELQVAIMVKLPEIGLLSSDFYIRKESGELIPSALRTWQERPERWENIYEKSINCSSLNLPVKTPRKDFSIFLGNLYYHLLKDPYVSTCSAIVRSSCLNPVIKFDEALNVFEDWEFFARLSRDNISAFLNIETTINRGHVDEVRLTRCSPKIKARCRIKLIEQVWKSDDDFMNKYGGEAKAIENEQLIALAKYQLLESEVKDAKRTLKKLSGLRVSGKGMKIFILTVSAYLPGGYRILIIARNIHRVFLTMKRWFYKHILHKNTSYSLSMPKEING